VRSGRLIAPEKTLALLGTAGCALAVAVALGSERLLGLVPCAFCLIERQPYYAGIALGLLALALPKRPARAALWALALLVLTGAALSLVHVGVEQHWWPDPLPECTVPDLRGLTPAQRLAAMPARAAKPCEDPDYLIPGLPVSMTQMSLAYGLAFSAALAMSLASTKGRKSR
jgi:disulfide bond formation protein DsbB